MVSINPWLTIIYHDMNHYLSTIVQWEFQDPKMEVR